MKTATLKNMKSAIGRIIAPLAMSTILLTGCYQDIATHHNAHIGGYIGLVDLESASLPGLDGYSNISSYFPPSHDEYMYFVKKYIFENWGSNGPEGQAQFWREATLGSDWIDQKLPGEGGAVEVPFTCDICVENGGMYLRASSWQQPWKSFEWKIKTASSSELVLVNEKSKYYFKITKGDHIAAADAYDEESIRDKHAREL